MLASGIGQYCPVPSSAPDLEEGANEIKEGVVNETKEEVEVVNKYEILSRWVAEVEQSEMRDVPGIAKRNSEGDWVVNENHPWVFEVRECAKKVQELYNSLKKGGRAGAFWNEEGTREYRDIAKLKAKVAKLEIEIDGEVPVPKCCKRSTCNEALARIAGAVCIVGVVVLGVYGMKWFVERAAGK